MPIDPTAVGATGGPVDISWSSKDALLYALGVGCGTDELQFATEKDQLVLPTFAVIVGEGTAQKARSPLGARSPGPTSPRSSKSKSSGATPRPN